jgi:hypothetical protein
MSNQGVLEVQYLKEESDSLLSEKAKQQMSKKMMRTLLQDESGECIGKTIYLVTRVRSENVQAGLEKITNELNSLAEEELILGSLLELGVVKLARMPLQVQLSAVFAYPTIKIDKIDRAKELCSSFTPEEVLEEQSTGNTEPDPEPIGTVVVVARATHPEMMIKGQSADTFLHREVNSILRILPKHTVYVGATKCDPTDLTIPYELRFKSPYFNDFKEIRLNYVRCMGVHPDNPDKLVQDILLLSIDYIKRDGTKAYQIG